MTIHDERRAAEQAEHDAFYDRAIASAHDNGYARGKADGREQGAADRQPEFDQLTLDRASLQDAFDKLQAEYAAHLASHAPSPEPQHPSTLYGFWAGSVNPTTPGTARGNYDRVAGYLGAPQVYRMFYPGMLPSTFKGSNADFGPPVVVSFKAPPAEVIAGKHDARFTAWLLSTPLGRLIWWCYYHEPEDNIEDEHFTAAEYRAAWEHLLKLAEQVIGKRDTLRPTMILMGYSLVNKARKISDYVGDLPAKGLQVLAWDSYLTPNTKTADGVVEACRKVSESYGLRFGIGETAVDPKYVVAGKSTAQLNLELAQRLRRDAGGAEFVCWFESFKTEKGVPVDWRIAPHLPAVTAYKG